MFLRLLFYSIIAKLKNKVIKKGFCRNSNNEIEPLPFSINSFIPSSKLPDQLLHVLLI